MPAVLEDASRHPQLPWLRHLLLTDYDNLLPFQGERSNSGDDGWAVILGVLLSPGETPYQRLQKNLRELRSMGAHSEEPDALYGSVTGFPFGLDEPAINRGLRGPEALRPSKKLRVLWWGSPHPGPSSSRAHVESHGRVSCSTAFKTNAFHSMAWTCSGLVAMCFPDKYKVEFRQPRSLGSSNRQLIVALAFCREYVPMCSGNDERYAIPSAAIDRTMIAMLLPSENRMRVIYRDNGAVDIGMTLLNYVDNLTDDEYAVALGCYDCSMERELLLAASEMAVLQYCKRLIKRAVHRYFLMKAV